MKIITIPWRRVSIIAAVVAASLLVAMAAGYAWLGTSLPRTDGEVAVPGFTAPVEIIRDDHGIPAIFAETEGDAYAALGFVHAQDRLWQMEMQRRTAAGRLAEIVGPDAFNVDRYMRTLGLYRNAEASLARLPSEVRAALDAYAAGVNAFLATRHGALPPEFVLLRHEPEPWRPVDSLLWGRLMAVQLSFNWKSELLRARLATTVPAARLKDLWPDHPVTEDELRGWSASTSAVPTGGTARFAATNAWAVDGVRSRSGKPLLATDPHLGFTSPILWYLARIEAPGLALAGATVPGVPFLVFGHNGRVAWGFAASQSDTEDLFVEPLVEGNATEYRTPDGPRRFLERQETIAVKGEGDRVVTIRESRHGPVVSDLLSRTDGAEPDMELALAAPYLTAEDLSTAAMYRLNRARWGDEVVRLSDAILSPHLNLAYADTAGQIGILSPGRLPARGGGSGFLPAMGDDGRHDWTGYLPADAVPRRVDPDIGFVVNANDRLVSTQDRWRIVGEWAPGHRAARITELLSARAVHDLDSMAAIQLDTVSLMAREVVPVLVDFAPQDSDAADALGLLRDWDGDMAADRAEPLLLYAWLRRLTHALFADELGARFGPYWDLRPRAVAAALSGKSAASWCDDVTTAETAESCAEIRERTFNETLAELRAQYGRNPLNWRWDEAHAASFAHAVFSRVPLLRGWAGLRVPAPGGNYTVNMAMTAINRGEPFEALHGAGLRAIYDLADLDAARFVIATGQSGNPFSRHYHDLAGHWRDGRYVTLGGGRARWHAEAAGVLRLTPETAD